MKSRWWKLIVCASILAALSVVMLNAWVVVSQQAVTYSELARLPVNDVGLVLGSSRTTANGYSNPHFVSRLDAAAAAHRAGKVKWLLLSGDNHTPSYDEPTDMKKELLERGVPESAIILDYAGFRTFDSVVRAKKVSGVEKMTVISE